MKKWIRINKLPLFVGLALLALPVLYLISEGTNPVQLNPHNHEIQNTLTYFLLVLFSYGNHTVFVPRWYIPKRYVRYLAVVAGCMLGVALIPQRIEQWVFLQPPREPTTLGWIRQLFWEENLFPPRHRTPGEHRPPRPDGPGRPPDDSSRFPTAPLSLKLGIIFLLCSVSALTSISVQTNNRLRQLETEKLQAELRQLKAQIQPHFLFNTLNSIYALALRKDDRTAQTVVKLAEFMRYIIRDAHHNQVSLEKEMAYIGNYIDLQRARLRDSVPVHFSLEGESLDHRIAPLVLFSFIENAFKHGVNPEQESEIRIAITIQNRQLHLAVFNKKVTISHLEESHGIGLQNARDRLRMLYPDSHHLTVDDDARYFRVDLKLTLL